MKFWEKAFTAAVLGASVCLVLAQQAQQEMPPAATTPPSPEGAPVAKKRAPRPPLPGVSTPGVKREMSTLQPQAVFTLGGAPDWQVLTDDAVWLSNGPLNAVQRLDIKTNQLAATINTGKRPCSGLAAGFGSVWVPVCGDKELERIDIATNTIVAKIPVAPADSEGGVDASPDAIWIVSDPAGKLSRIDPKTNTVAATIDVPPGSASAMYADGAVWITTPEKGLLTRVDAKTNKVTDTIPVGPQPRFQTYGAGSVWTLNQGDGTVTRVDTKTRKVTATIEVGIPTKGGELAFGNGHVWATVFQIPISEIDPAVNKVVKQWTGPGGDSIRVGHGSVWLSNLRDHNVWRIDPKTM